MTAYQESDENKLDDENKLNRDQGDWCPRYDNEF